VLRSTLGLAQREAHEVLVAAEEPGVAHARSMEPWPGPRWCGR
jgi:hypothetical protein